MDVVSFCSELIKRKSVTPNDDGILDYVSEFLSSVGFETKILEFKSADGKNVVKNLFAKHGHSRDKVLGFLGHLDVVPAGDGWNAFAAEQKDGHLIGRGVADMKGGAAAFCCAVAEYVKQNFDGTISFFLTCDEEIGSFEGAQSLIKWAKENNELPTDCLIGEPSSDATIGDRIFAGHRGSMNVVVRSHGKQGHVAYPSKNSLTSLCRYIARMVDYNWRYENKKFPKTKVEPTLLYTNNYAQNVVPDESSANINIRYSADYESEELKKIFTQQAEGLNLELEFIVNGDAYYCESHLQDLLAESIKETVGIKPEFSAAGGTSDGRYMVKHCNVIEFGLRDATMHQKNERVKISDLYTLEKIYAAFLKRYFA